MAKKSKVPDPSGPVNSPQTLTDGSVIGTVESCESLPSQPQTSATLENFVQTTPFNQTCTGWGIGTSTSAPTTLYPTVSVPRPGLKRICRDSYGLIIGVDYIFTEDGLVDWRKMLKPEHLVPNRQKTTETDINKLEDSQLLILLSGIRYLAALRGFKSFTFKDLRGYKDYCSVCCEIGWIGNYETEGREVISAAAADSRSETTENFAVHFLAAIAENRAFIRAVRNFLNIKIIAQDEIKKEGKNDEPVSQESPTDPKSLLDLQMKAAGLSLAQVKAKLVKEGRVEAENWEKLGDIPKTVVFELIDRIKNKIEGKK